KGEKSKPLIAVFWSCRTLVPASPKIVPDPDNTPLCNVKSAIGVVGALPTVKELKMVSPGEFNIVALKPPLALGVRLMENWVKTVSLTVVGTGAPLLKRVVKLFVKVSVAVLELTMDNCHAPLTPSICETVITSA